MGDGRSGSTILSVILNAHPEIQTIGEINKWIPFNGKVKRGNSKNGDAVFWDDILNLYSDRAWSGSFTQLEKAQNLIEPYKYFPTLLLKKTPSWAQELYHDHSRKLVTILANYTGKKIVVDSSKNMGRALMLLRNPYLDTRVIHLTRGPRATMRSITKKNVEQKYKSPIIGMLQYNLKNYFCMLVGWTSPRSTVIRVRYEDIALSPKTEFKRLGDFLGLDLDSLANKLLKQEPFTIPPLLDGNRVRLKDKIIVQYDDSWKKDLSRSKKILALLITFLFSCIFGYLKQG